MIKIGELDVHLSRKRIKNINLRIDRNGKVAVSAPMRCSVTDITQFLLNKQEWIGKHRQRFLKELSATQHLQTTQTQLFLGEAYSLRVQEYSGRNGVVLDNEYLYCYLQTTATEKIKRGLITDWQRQQMQSLLPALIQKWESIIGVHANHWIIKSMKTRWGSCHIAKKRICLNLYLIQYPLICLEYVIVHELVHLLEASHNQRFYAFMNQFMPEWKQYRNRLKRSLHH